MSAQVVQSGSADKPAALSTVKRCLFGGAGAIAPLIVLAISVDPKTVFISFTIIVFAGYAVKATLLFLVGGFVGFLQRNESDEFKCFIMGISAPALITTYAASGAHAAPTDQIDRIIPTISVELTDLAFGEDWLLQFKRGFSGSNPQTTIAIVGKTKDELVARRDAAAITLYVDCSIQGKIINQTAERGFDEASLRDRGLSSDTIVVYPPWDNNTFFVLLKLGPPSVAVDYLNVIRGPIDVSHYTVINQAQGPEILDKALKYMDISYLPPDFAINLVRNIRPDCVWNRGYSR